VQDREFRVSSQKDELCASIIALSSGVIWIVIVSLSTMSRNSSGLLRHGHDEPAQLDGVSAASEEWAHAPRD
jgi:hypothetical protein